MDEETARDWGESAQAIIEAHQLDLIQHLVNIICEPKDETTLRRAVEVYRSDLLSLDDRVSVLDKIRKRMTPAEFAEKFAALHA
jgi:hypothetical protein